MNGEEAKRREVLAYASAGSLGTNFSFGRLLYGLGIVFLFGGMSLGFFSSPRTSEVMLGAIACGILSLRKDGAS